jgi:hypothetical protein
MCQKVRFPLFLTGSTSFESRTEATHFSPSFSKLLVIQGDCGLAGRYRVVFWDVMRVDWQIVADVSEEFSVSLQGQAHYKTLLLDSLTLKIEALRSFETSVNLPVNAASCPRRLESSAAPL